MNDPYLARHSSHHPLCTAICAVGVSILLLFCLAGDAAGQDGAIVPDKPYYRVGETVRIEYRFPGVDEDQYIHLYMNRSWGYNKRRKDFNSMHRKTLNRIGKGVIELPKLTEIEGPVRVSIEHPLLENPPVKWIWVFPDLDPWPNAMSVTGGNGVRIGDEFTVVVQRPTGEGEEPHDLTLKLVRPAFIVEGGAVDQEHYERSSKYYEEGWLGTKESSKALQAPYLPHGAYELRLLESKTRSVLACMPLEVMPPIAENLVAPAGPSHRINREVSPGYIYGKIKPWSPLYFSDHRTIFGVDELVTISIASEEEIGGPPEYLAALMKKYGKLALRVKRDVWDDSNTEPARVFDSVELGQKVSFKVSELGYYRAELGAVGPKGWIRKIELKDDERDMDYGIDFNDESIVFSCKDPDRSGVIRFDKPFYRPGDTVYVTLEPDAGWPIQDAHLGEVTILKPDGGQIRCKMDEPNLYAAKLPIEGGVFKLRWHDGTKLINEALFRVPIELEPDRLRIVGGGDIKYGEHIRVEVNIDKLQLQSKKTRYGREAKVMVTLMARGEMSPTGTWKEPKVIEDHVVEESGTFEFEAPFPGRYEVRLSAGLWILRSDKLPQYILARIGLEVPGSGGAVPFLPGGPDAPEPTDLPFNAKEYGSAIADDIRMADVHCAEFRPLAMVDNSRPSKMIADADRENADEVIAENVVPGYPSHEPIERPRYVFTATTQPPSDKINRQKFHLPDLKGVKSFLVFVAGQDLFGDSRDRQLEVESKAPGVRVTPAVLLNAMSDDMFDSRFDHLTEGWGKDQKDWITSMDALYLWFDVDAGVLPGAKRFVINGVEADWILKRGTVTAHMTAARSDWRGSHQETDVAYHHDEITVEVKTSAPAGVKELEVRVLVDGKKPVLVGMESLVLTSSSQGNTFSSGPIRIAASKARAEAMGGAAIVAPEHSQISLVTGFYPEFDSQPTTSLIVSVTPARMISYFPILESKTNRTSSYLWKDALLEAANIAGKKVTDWDELTLEEAGEITNFIVTELSNRRVNVTVGQHAGMILLRRLFIEQMELYLSTLPEKPDRNFVRLWHEMVRPHMNDHSFGPGQIEIRDLFANRIVTYRQALSRQEGTAVWLERRARKYAYTLDGQAYTMKDDLDRRAYLGWRKAVINSLKIAKDTDIKDREDMVELTGQGFDPIVQMLLPRLVKLEDRTLRQSVWMPDELAQLTVQSIRGLANDARAIDAVGVADTTLIISAASLGFLAPATVPARILCLAIEAGMAVEAGSQVYDYFKSIEAVDFALGSTAVLGGDRLTEARSRAIPGWGVTLGVVGSVVGLGSETYSLVAAVRVSRAVDRAVQLLPEIEKGGLDTFQALSRNDQVSVLTAISATKSDELTKTFKAELTKTRLEDYGAMLERQAKNMELTGTVAPPETWITKTEMMGDNVTLVTGGSSSVNKAIEALPKPGQAFRIKGADGPEDIIIGKFIAQGTFSRVYAIQGESSRVIKFSLDAYSKSTGELIRSGRDSVINAQRVHKLLKDNDIFQLRISQFAPDAPQPYMIQNGLIDGEHIWFEYLKEKRTTVINGIEHKVSAVAGLKSAQNLTPDGKLPPEMQRAILRLYKKLANGEKPMVWEDGHMENIFFVKDGDGYKAGILDQDRITRFDNIHADEGLSTNVYGMEWVPEQLKIESLRNRTRPDNWLRVIERRGSLAPSADYFMGKMLEYGGRYIKYNRKTGEFEKILFDPKIVEEFFPKLKQWVDPDLTHLGGGVRLIIFPRHLDGLNTFTVEDRKGVLIEPSVRAAA